MLCSKRKGGDQGFRSGSTECEPSTRYPGGGVQETLEWMSLEVRIRSGLEI